MDSGFSCIICDEKFSSDQHDVVYECDNAHIFCQKHLEEIKENYGEEEVLDSVRCGLWIPSHYCPICIESKINPSEHHIDEDDLFVYLLIKTNMGEDDVIEEIMKKFETLEDFYNHIGKYGID
jgi:hypothetical protein